MTVAPMYSNYDDVYDTGVLVPLQLPPSDLPPPGADDDSDGDVMLFARLFMCNRGGVDRVFVQHPMFSRSGGGVYTYQGPGANSDLGTMYSILCQASLAAPVLLWKTSSSHGTEECEGDWDPLGASTSTSAPDQPPQPPELPVAFVANDWPCGVLPLWLRNHLSPGHASPDPDPPLPETQPPPPPPSSAESSSNGSSSAESSSSSSSNTGESDDDSAQTSSSPISRPDLQETRQQLARGLQGAKVAFCLHNHLHEGNFDTEEFEGLGLPPEGLSALLWPPEQQQLRPAESGGVSAETTSSTGPRAEGYGASTGIGSGLAAASRVEYTSQAPELEGEAQEIRRGEARSARREAPSLGKPTASLQRDDSNVKNGVSVLLEEEKLGAEEAIGDTEDSGNARINTKGGREAGTSKKSAERRNRRERDRSNGQQDVGARRNVSEAPKPRKRMDGLAAAAASTLAAAGGRIVRALNWLAAGMVQADALVTVSPSYAEELQAGEGGASSAASAVELSGGIR